ncbi:2-oxo acid dehydrogenase subunit E2 [Candidatus Poribacteria bacterium]|nr:2-oxo acid dehydrogenase subunit E2 [Candidatus Poribacteria bacterium]
MEKEFTLPELGENIESGDIVNILVSVGDTIQKEQPVVEIETDKAAIEVPSSMGGVVKAIYMKVGEKAQVGQPILSVETEAESEEPAEAKVEVPEAKERAATEAEPPEFEAEEAVEVKEGALKVGEKEIAPPSPQPWRDAPREVAPAAPSVRRFAREIGIDINQVRGSGPGGRISIEDVKNYARQITAELKSPEPPPPVPTGRIVTPSLPDFSKWGAVERKRMGNVRYATAKHLSLAWSTIPHVSHSDKADITELEQLRKDFGGRAEAAGGKLTITAILLKVAVSALKRFPQFNASVEMEKVEIIYKKYYHIGVAVDTDRGLLVPVIRDVDRKSILELSVELTQISEKTRNRKLSLEEMQGGTFTITNLGGISGTHFSPIVNHPEVAILGVARSRIEPVFIDGQFQPRTMLPLTLSYDHRLIDGADAARFVRWMVDALEQPFLIALEG